MPRARDYAAEYRARQARSQSVYGRGYGAKEGARGRRAAHRPAPADRGARPTPRRVELPGGGIVRAVGSRAERDVRAAVVEAARKGQPVEITVTFETPKGPRSKRLTGPPGDGGGEGGGGGGGRDRGAWEAGATPIGPVQVHSGTAASRGADASVWLDYFEDMDGDIWESLWEAFGDEYY